MESGLNNFTAYRKALELFYLVVLDLRSLASRFELSKLVSQQIASADSIAVNIEEGYPADPKRNTHSSSSSLEAQPKKLLDDMRE